MSGYLSSGATAVGDYLKRSPETLFQLGSALVTPFSPMAGQGMNALGIGSAAYGANDRNKEYQDVVSRYDAIQRGEKQQKFNVPGMEDRMMPPGRQSGLPMPSRSGDVPDYGRGAPPSQAGYGAKQVTTGPKPLTPAERGQIQRGPPSTTAEVAKAGIPLVGQGLSTYMQMKSDRDKEFTETLRPTAGTIMSPMQAKGNQLTMADLAKLIAAFKSAGQKRTI